jgi:Domain of unknown function (DUF6471)
LIAFPPYIWQIRHGLARRKFADTLSFRAYPQTLGNAMSVKEIEREWAEKAQRFVKAELKRADVTYEELANRLRAMGLQETKVSIASKLSRAGFSASFFLATMKAIGRQTVNLEDV